MAVTQAPMISSPLKQTNEIDWISPLKSYIRETYGDDPDRYSEECATLNRLRQDMRGAGKDSAAGRDLLYRYYGQLELLDLRFPVDENHIKISFTWFDAFTLKPTSQYSLAYEKASIIYNISAVLSCHAAYQNRSQDAGLKTAYHSFQASAGMFTYINENFLHAPSTDLSRETVKTLIAIMLAQGQEVFLEKQIADGKKVGLLAKLASQAAFLYGQAVEGVQDNVNRAIFEKVWLSMSQIKSHYMGSVAQFYQAIADNDANAHGASIARLQIAEILAKDAHKVASSFPSSVPISSNLGSETGPSLMEITRRHIATIQGRLREFLKDNDFIYHQPVPAEASLPVIPKLPAAKAIPVSDLYQGEDIQRIIGPDIFQRIVPMAVTESASLYDEEKAKLIRAESEKVEIANGEMAATLDYLKLPGSLKVLRGGNDSQGLMDDDFKEWCEELAGHESFSGEFDHLAVIKDEIGNSLKGSSKQLDVEESVCEKMRSKYGGDWTQQPSSRLTTTLRNDTRNYRTAMEEANTSDSQLFFTFRQHESDFDEMRSAGEVDEADVLFQRAMVKAGHGKGKGRNGSPLSPSNVEGNLLDADFEEDGYSVIDQIDKVEELLRKLNLLKNQRAQVLKDLKEKVHNDDISSVLILNKKSITNHEQQLFQQELEKFRPHQSHLLQANHKQSQIMKELNSVYGQLLQDKRVRAEQSKYEAITRQRSAVVVKYRKIHQAFVDLTTGLQKATNFYTEMRETVDSLEKNVEVFVNNRRSEGAQLLGQIERDRSGAASGQADRERERLKELMERMSMDPSTTSPQKQKATSPRVGYGGSSNPFDTAPESLSTQYPSINAQPRYNAAVSSYSYSQQQPPPNGQHAYRPTSSDPYNSAPYFRNSPVSPQGSGSGSGASFARQSQSQQHHQYQSQPAQPAQPQQGQWGYVPPGYVPPPPPPGPPPLGPQQTFPNATEPYPVNPDGSISPPPQQVQQRHPAAGQGHVDPWAGLNAWK
ncbi:MAG: bck1-like resistance to osmotic shock [Vezdaea aestivalis]|nr:MAG: bck1-like resistance to osmotic shock [Vezdaea aestivalis]